MARKFNTAVTCNPEKHYLVDISEKMKYLEGLIEDACYFTINRARQFGKSTILNFLIEELNDQYHFVYIDYTEFSENDTENFENFKKKFCSYLSRLSPEVQHEDFASIITNYCSNSTKPVVLVIDNIDSNFKNEPFVDFLSCTRATYQKRNLCRNVAFHSVILSGSYCFVNLCHEFEMGKNYSPWNVAADFNLDMTFHPHEIAQMLSDYEADYHTGMDIKAISEEIYRYTFGYPVLVSALCKIVDEQLDKDWTLDGILKSVKALMKSTEFTLTDDLSKNLNNYPELHKYLFDISVNGAQYSFSPLDPVMKMAHMFGYIKEKDGQVVIHNLFFEEAMHLYFTEEYKRKNSFMDTMSRSVYIQNGTLNMENIIRRFSDLMHEEYRDRDQKFIEQQGRLLFLCYLKPIINGTGFYYVEPQTRENARMDLVVTYNHKEYIIELKIWHGTKYETDGKVQLAEYLDTKNISEGYLVTFSFLKNKTYSEPEWKVQDGKRIFEAVI